MTRVLRPPKVARIFTVSGPAIYRDEFGAPSPVVVLSDPYRDAQTGATMRRCAFLKEMGQEYEVNVTSLVPCDEDHRPLAPQPVELATLRGRAVETADYGEGLVYAPEPYRRRVVGVHPVMEKFDRVNATPPPNLVLDGATMSPDQWDRFKEATRLAASEGGKGIYDRREARRLMNELQAELGEQRARQEIDRGTVQTVADARRRGEVLQVAEGKIKRIDGLDSLKQSGAIDPIEHLAGMKYRDVWEAALDRARLTSSYGESGGGGTNDPDRERMMRLRKLAKDQILTELHGHVQANVRSPLAITALRLTAGEGRPVSHYRKGSGRTRSVEALQMALEVLAIRWGLK